MTRIGVTVQTGNERNVAFFADATAILAVKSQQLLEQNLQWAREAFENQLANLLIILFTPASMLALVFGLWRVSADLGWTEDFIIASGFFSHWQVWMALALALKFAGSALQARMPIPAKTSAEN
jgi:hypothetical protein